MTMEVTNRRRFVVVARLGVPLLATVLLIYACAATFTGLARAGSHASTMRELLKTDVAILDEASYVNSVMPQRKSELRRRTARLFDSVERVSAEAAVLRYVAEAANLASLKRNALQVEGEEPKKNAATIRVVASFDYEGEYSQVVEYLRLLQAPITEVETLRVVPVHASLQGGGHTRINVSGKVAFYGLMRPVQGT